jgi:predicted permease
MSSALLLVPDFSLILIGWLLVRYTPFDRGFWAGVERLVYFVLFPALLLQSTNSAKFDFSSTSAMLGLALLTMVFGMATGIWSSGCCGRHRRISPRACRQPSVSIPTLAWPWPRGLAMARAWR